MLSKAAEWGVRRVCGGHSKETHLVKQKTCLGENEIQLAWCTIEHPGPQDKKLGSDTNCGPFSCTSHILSGFHLFPVNNQIIPLDDL